MINILLSENGVLEMTLTGEVTAEDVQQATDAVRPRLEAREPLALLLDLSGLKRLSLGAVARDIKEGFKLLRYLGTPIRCALLAERGLITGLARFEAMLLPGIDLQVFAPEDRDAARRWVAKAMPVERKAHG